MQFWNLIAKFLYYSHSKIISESCNCAVESDYRSDVKNHIFIYFPFLFLFVIIKKGDNAGLGESDSASPKTSVSRLILSSAGTELCNINKYYFYTFYVTLFRRSTLASAYFHYYLLFCIIYLYISKLFRPIKLDVN